MSKTSWRRRRFLVAISSILVVLSPVKVEASDSQYQDLRIVVADDSDATKRITETLQRRFPGASVLSELSAQARRRSLAYIAVGPAALRNLISKEIDAPIVTAFTSSQAYRSIVDSTPKHGSVTAIYAEPAPIDQMQLIAAIYKRRVNVATLVTDKTNYLVPALRHAAAAAGLDLTIERIDAPDNLNRALNLISQAPVILAVPDTTIYNGENIRNVLVTSYRHSQAVVGFSAALVKAGALATSYSSVDDIAMQLGELLDEYAASGRLPAPQFPKYFSTVVNESVARSLNLVVDDEARKLARKPGGRVP